MRYVRHLHMQAHRLADQDVLPADACAWWYEAVIIKLVIHSMTHAWE
jgi:hypothetical protein